MSAQGDIYRKTANISPDLKQSFTGLITNLVVVGSSPVAVASIFGGFIHGEGLIFGRDYVRNHFCVSILIGLYTGRGCGLYAGRLIFGVLQ